MTLVVSVPKLRKPRCQFLQKLITIKNLPYYSFSFIYNAFLIKFTSKLALKLWI